MLRVSADEVRELEYRLPELAGVERLQRGRECLLGSDPGATIPRPFRRWPTGRTRQGLHRRGDLAYRRLGSRHAIAERRDAIGRLANPRFRLAEPSAQRP